MVVGESLEEGPNGHTDVDESQSNCFLGGGQVPLLFDDGEDEPDGDGLGSLAEHENCQGRCHFPLGLAVADSVVEDVLEVGTEGFNHRLVLWLLLIHGCYW